MTKVSDSSSGHGSLPDLVNPLVRSGNLHDALHVAGDGAVALAQGSAAAGLLLTRQGLEVTKNLVDRAQEVRREKSASLSPAPRRRKAPRPGRKALLTTGVLAVLAFGAVALFRSRRPAHPPIAPEPPRARPVATDAADKPGSAPR